MAQTYDRRINLYINGTQVKNDAASIRKEMYKLSNELNRMTIGSDEYIAHARKIRTLKGILDEHQAQLRETQKSWFSIGKMADGFNRYFAMATTFMASFAGVALTVKSTVQAFAEYDDKLADVMKTTGLTRDQVVALDKAFAEMDTRSSQQELLDLARVAGKLGISAQEDVLGFVRAADKIKVALSEDLGGDVEESINQLGKIMDVFKVDEEFGIEEALLKIGSAINSLGAAGTANEAYLVEFSKRLAGIAPSAKISIQEVLGLGATLDELGQTSEVSGTVVNNVIAAMFKDTATYAGIAHMSLKDFTELMNRDANEAFIKLLQGAKGSGTGFAEMAKNLDALGLDGARSTAVLGALADNIDKLREKQAYSNAEFEKGTSIIDEFNIKNNTTQAQLDKAKDALNRIYVSLGKELVPAYLQATNILTRFLTLMTQLPGWLIRNQGLIIAAATAYLVYNSALTAVIANKIKDAALDAKRLVIDAALKIAATARVFYMQAELLLMQKRTAAQVAHAETLKKSIALEQTFNNALRANPIGVLITAVMALVAAVKLYDSYNKQTIANEKEKTEAVNDLATANSTLEASYSGIQKQITNLNTLSIQQKKNLQDEIDLTLQKAEAELIAQKSIQEEIKLHNTRATLWQKLKAFNGWTAITKGISNQLAEDAMKNGAEAAATMNDGLGLLLDNIQKLRSQKVDLSNILNAEAIGDAIGTESLVQMEEKLSKYQTALKNAAVGSEDYLRIQQKIARVEEQMGRTRSALSDPKETEKRNKETLDALELALAAHQNLIKESYYKSEINQDEYQARMLASELGYLELKKQMLADQGKSTIEVESLIWDKRIELQKQKAETIEQLQKQMDDKIKEMADTQDDALDAEVEATIKNGQAVMDEKERLKNREQQIMEERARAYLDLAQGIGESFEEMLLSQEISFGQFLKNTLMMALDALEKIMIMNITQVTMEGIAKSGLNPTALIKAFAKIVAIKAAFATVKGLVLGGGEKAEKKASGGYTNGARMYMAGEAGKEWIAPNRMLMDPVIGPKIAALEGVRTGQLSPAAIDMFASGGYTTNTTSNLQPGTRNPELGTRNPEPDPISATLAALAYELQQLRKWKPKVYTEMIKKDLDTLDEIDNKR